MNQVTVQLLCQVKSSHCIYIALFTIQISSFIVLIRKIVCRRNQNSIVLLWPEKKQLFKCRLQQRQIVQRTGLVPVVLSRWPSIWRGLRRGSVSGLSRSSLGADPLSDLNTDRIRATAVTIQSGYSLDLGGYRDLGIKMRQSNISVDATEILTVVKTLNIYTYYLKS